MNRFEPRIIGFLCNWCSYAGADLAGVSRIQYPPNIHPIRVMCSGRVEPELILSLFVEGVDGVLVMGCHIGDCHYISGNLHAKRKIALAKRLLAKADFEEDRLRLEWVSASEGQKFAKLVSEFTDQLRSLGPSTSSNPGVVQRLKAAQAAAAGYRLRALVGKEEELVSKGNAYGMILEQNEFDAVMTRAVEDEYERHFIHNAVSVQPSSVKELSQRLGIRSSRLLQHIVVLRQRGWIDIQETRGQSPVYGALEVRV